VGWAAALGLPALLYGLTLYMGPGGRVSIGDAVKFQFIGRTLSVPHEPGYPQYVILNFLWSYLPLPMNLASKINLLSAVYALIAGALVFALTRRVSRSTGPAVLATWFLLLSADIWLLAVQAEVYTLNLAWVAAVVYTGWRWQSSRDRKWLVAMMFCYALSFGNHLLMITLLPALIVLVLATDPAVLVNGRMLAAGAAAVALGLSQYGLLWWRSYHPLRNMLSRFPAEASFFDILQWSAGAHFTERHFLSSGAGAWPGRLAETWGRGLWSLTPLVVLLAMYGLVLLWRRERPLAGFLVAIAVGVTAFAAAYEIRSWPYYCFPAWLALVVAASAGMADVFKRSSRVRLTTLAVLVISLTYVASTTFASLRATPPPVQNDLALVAVPANGVVIPLLAGRTAQNLGRYYRAANGPGKLDEVAFIGGRELILDWPMLTGNHPIFVQSARDADWLFRRGIETIYVPDGAGPGREFDGFGLIAADPVREIRYQKFDGRKFTMGARAKPARRDVQPSVYVTIVNADRSRVRTTLHWLVASSPEWREDFRMTMGRIRPRETVAVLALELGSEDLSSIAESLNRVTDMPAEFDDSPRDVVIAAERDGRGVPPLIFDFADRVVVPVPLPLPVDPEGQR